MRDWKFVFNIGWKPLSIFQFQLMWYKWRVGLRFECFYFRLNIAMEKKIK